ncbi:DUF2125 domain-containing protein [Belnapia sp. T6]|uniref:DUF2125 domain-containing protein n=1 Tax=Belnapia mucosa TaxID=2804532 RepID=A0ABS1V242_9PROT|nr:DUF2125 domain-containing protein [Belnapia mucosa]MBL6455743.1 DUF2125 domain-containing protein [Belnapia mucosa]
MLAKRVFLSSLFTLLLLLAGHGLLWLWLAGRLEEGFAAWATARRASGWQVAHGPPERGGWPLSASLTLPGFRLSGGEGLLPGGIDWQAEAVTLRLAPPRLRELAVEMPGQHQLRLGPLAGPAVAQRLVATMPLDQGPIPPEIRLGGSGLRLDATEIGAARLRIGNHLEAREGEAAMTLTGGADAVLLPPGASPLVASLGRSLDRIGLDLVLDGPLPGRGSAAGRAAAWRDAGGTLGLRSLELRWGPVTAGGEATLGLDDRLQPMGAGTLRLEGADAALNAAAAAGLLPPRNAFAVRAVVAILSRLPPEGGPPRLEVPLALERGQLNLARIPLARLPDWDWGQR